MGLGILSKYLFIYLIISIKIFLFKNKKKKKFYLKYFNPGLIVYINYYYLILFGF